MGKVGKYKYPENVLGDVVESLFKLKDFFGENIHDEITREAIADAWNIAYRSGPFNKKVASLIHYGFAERVESGKIKLTQLAMDILFPLNNSDIEAKRKAFFNVQLFKDIYEAYGDKPTVDQIKWILRQKGNAEPAIAEKKAPDIRKIYIEGVKEISIDEGQRGKTPETGPSIEGVKGMDVAPSEDVVVLRDGIIVLQLPLSKDAVEIARSLLDHFERTRLKKLKPDEKPETEREH